MAKRTKKEAAEVYVDGLVAAMGLSGEEAAQWKTKLLSNDKAVDFTGEHILLRDDYSRAMDEGRGEIEKAKQTYEQAYSNLEAHQANATKWYQDNVAELDKGTKAQQRLDALAKAGIVIDQNPPPPANPANPGNPQVIIPENVVTKEEFTNSLARLSANMMQQGAQYMSTLSRLSAQHMKDFDEVLDGGAVHAHGVKIGAPTLDVAYEDFAKDKLKAKKEQDALAERKKMEEEIRADVMKKMGNMMPYGVDRTESSSIAALKGNGTVPTGESALAAAVEEYNKSAWGRA